MKIQLLDINKKLEPYNRDKNAFDQQTQDIKKELDVLNSQLAEQNMSWVISFDDKNGGFTLQPRDVLKNRVLEHWIVSRRKKSSLAGQVINKGLIRCGVVIPQIHSR